MLDELDQLRIVAQVLEEPIDVGGGDLSLGPSEAVEMPFALEPASPRIAMKVALLDQGVEVGGDRFVVPGGELGVLAQGLDESPRLEGLTDGEGEAQGDPLRGRERFHWRWWSPNRSRGGQGRREAMLEVLVGKLESPQVAAELGQEAVDEALDTPGTVDSDTVQPATVAGAGIVAEVTFVHQQGEKPDNGLVAAVPLALSRDGRELERGRGEGVH